MNGESNCFLEKGQRERTGGPKVQRAKGPKEERHRESRKGQGELKIAGMSCDIERREAGTVFCGMQS